MAKSIFDVLATGTTETSVPSQGKDIKGNALTFEHTLPEGLFPDDQEFESPSALLAWSESNGFTHAILQRGIQKFLIEVRATYKGCKKDDTWDEAYGQVNVDEMEWTEVKRPNQGGTRSLDKARYADCLAMIAQLMEQKMDVETIKTMTTGIYGAVIVEAIFEALN
ncbi:MAG: hypothetical protein PF440_04810 [Thiomicrorhabdus sp.]|jgi:hypothetical protein|nr:hypothetical protein [Thiomicrorhabdus sp.]